MRFAWRIGLFLVLAGVSFVVLWRLVGGAAAKTAPPQPDGDPRIQRPADVPPGGRRVLERLPGVAEAFHLAADPAALPRDCAPVLAIAPDGRIELRIPPPLTLEPGALRWPSVGILLPEAAVARLGAAARSSLMEIWSRLSGGRAPRALAIRSHGCAFRPGELEHLLNWLR
ncbi:MAG: hypothetical protein H6836_05010 [Planctomycetes bacterium]|nr:hypothetical protein [Planctomycetota bacterium]